MIWTLIIGFSLLGSVVIGVSDYCYEEDQKKEKDQLYGVIRKQNQQIDELIQINKDLSKK